MRQDVTFEGTNKVDYNAYLANKLPRLRTSLSITEEPNPEPTSDIAHTKKSIANIGVFALIQFIADRECLEIGVDFPCFCLDHGPDQR